MLPICPRVKQERSNESEQLQAVYAPGCSARNQELPRLSQLAQWACPFVRDPKLPIFPKKYFFRLDCGCPTSHAKLLLKI